MACKKSQVSFEFLMIFTLIFLVLTGFIYVINIRLTDIKEQQEKLSMQSLANNIKNEIIIASSVNNNYLRNFNIPSSLNGKKYKMSILNDELSINLYEGDKLSREYFTILPEKVKGTFIEEITPNTTEHCITKNKEGEIRIARNQASLDGSKNTVKKQEIFDILVSLNCIQNIRSVQFTIKYDPGKLTLKGVKAITLMNAKSQSPLFQDVFGDILKYDSPYTDQSEGRLTFGYIGSSCESGSGNIANITFQAKDITNTKTEIEFDDLFIQDSLEIYDCNTDKFTKEDLPDSKNNAIIEITD